MGQLLRLASRRFYRRHPVQAGLALLGIALGVAVVVGVEIANQSAERAFELSSQAVNGSATHRVVSTADMLDESVYVRIKREFQVIHAAPVVEGSVRLDGFAGRLSLLGIDPLSRLVAGPWLARDPADLTALLTEPNAVMVTASLARELAAGVGDTVSMLSGGQTIELRIAGLVDSQDPLLKRMIFCDISTAQELLGHEGRLSRIDLRLDERDLARLDTWAVEQTRLEDAAANSLGLAQMTRAFRINLTALSLLALMVGAFLILNTFSFLVVRRRAFYGRLRTLGATRGEVFKAVLSEAVLFGAAASALGALLGLALGSGLVEIVLRTIDDLYFRVQLDAVAPTRWILLQGFVVGVIVSVLAALPAALEAVHSSPLDVQRRIELEHRLTALLPRLNWAAAALALIAWFAFSRASAGIEVAFFALFCVLVSAALITPALTAASIRLLGRLLGGRLGVIASFAIRSVSGAMSRTGVAVAGLSVAVATVIGISIMIASFRISVVDWLDTTLAADAVVVFDPTVFRSRDARELERLVRRVSAVDNVARVRQTRRVRVSSEGVRLRVWAVDEVTATTPFRFRHLGRTPSLEAFRAGRAVYVSESLAYKRGIGPGDVLMLAGEDAIHEFELAGVFVDYTTDQGVVAIDLGTYQQLWGDQLISGLGVYLDERDGLETAIARLRAITADTPGVLVQSNQLIKTRSLEVFDRTFTVTEVLRWLAACIAFFGILSALQALQLERVREVALLRALGFTPRQLFSLSLSQTGLLGLAAGLVAVPLGILLAALLVYQINVRAFGWSMSFTVPPEVIGQGMLLAMGAALLAGILPALRQARQAPAAALRDE